MPIPETKREEGNKYGELTVLKESKNRSKSGNTKWECSCSCGKVISVVGSQLRGSRNRKGQKKCLNCRKADQSNAPASPQARINFLYYRYGYMAKKRGIEFSLDKIIFTNLIFSNCYYCGVQPKQVCQKGKSKVCYNGIDRVDNSIHYIKENCVACCKQCNQAKMNYTTAEFKRWIKRIYRYTFC